jgi:hypothetical protein
MEKVVKEWMRNLWMKYSWVEHMLANSRLSLKKIPDNYDRMFPVVTTFLLFSTLSLDVKEFHPMFPRLFAILVSIFCWIESLKHYNIHEHLDSFSLSFVSRYVREFKRFGDEPIMRTSDNSWEFTYIVWPEGNVNNKILLMTKL